MLNFEKCGGLIPVIVQEYGSDIVLMLAYMNEAAFDEMLRTRRAVYFSRRRQELWRKGEESGNVQTVREIYVDCDTDTVLLKVEQIGGAACHDGYRTCFYRRLLPNGTLDVIEARVFDPKQIYKNRSET